MFYSNTLRLLVIFCVFFSFAFLPSYSLTESVDLFGQINSSDIILNDIWIEPEDPRNGEAITVHGSVYNAGTIPTGEVSEVVTIGYIVNGELLEFTILENVLPGIENGVEISSGPIFDATPGNYIVTVIINYHDTLSHLRDNPENNIVQKNFQIGTEVPSVISSNIFQKYNEDTGNQEVNITGQITDIFQRTVNEQEITIDIEGIAQGKAVTDLNGVFSYNVEIPYKDKPVKVTTYMKESAFLPTPAQNIFPTKMNDEESTLVLEITSDSNTDRFDFTTVTMVLFQESYDSLFDKIDINEDKQSKITDDYFLTIVPGNHGYIAEIYLEGRFLDAFQENIRNNQVIEKEIIISESAQVKFKITNEAGEPQRDVTVDNWIYSSSSNEYGFTDWIQVIPTLSPNDPYVAKATFPDGTVAWSEPFLIEPKESKVIQIKRGGTQ